MSFGGEGLFDVFSGESGAPTVEGKTNGEGKRKNAEPIGNTRDFIDYEPDFGARVRLTSV